MVCLSSHPVSLGLIVGDSRVINRRDLYTSLECGSGSLLTVSLLLLTYPSVNLTRSCVTILSSMFMSVTCAVTPVVSWLMHSG